VTKPGNSDPVEPSADKAEEPTDPTPEPEPATEAESETKPAEAKPAEAEPDEPATDEAESKAEEAAEAKPAEPKAARSKPVEDAEPLMVELEKAPPPPREEALRAQSKRRIEEPAPRTLRFSFYFFTAAGLVWLISAVIFLINKQTIADAQIENNTDPNITAEQIASAVNQLLWFYLVIAVVFTVFLGLFGYKATEGTRRARTLVTIFSAILVIFHLLLFSTQFGILSALLALVGLALIWTPTARAFFPPKQPLS
jgi:hypothetical protein